MGRHAFDPQWSPDDKSLALSPCSDGRMDELREQLTAVPVASCRRVAGWTKAGRYLIVEVGLRHATTATVAARDLDRMRSTPLFAGRPRHEPTRLLSEVLAELKSRLSG